METPYWCTVLVHQYGRRKSTKTSGVHFLYKSFFFFTRELAYVHINISSNTWNSYTAQSKSRPGFRLAWKWACQRFTMYVPTHRRRKPGRQPTLFNSYIHCLLGDPDIVLNYNQLLEMAKTAIYRGNLRSTAPLAKDGDAFKRLSWGFATPGHRLNSGYKLSSLFAQ